MTFVADIPRNEEEIVEQANRLWQRWKAETPWNAAQDRLLPLKLVYSPKAVRGVFAVKGAGGEAAVWRYECVPQDPDQRVRHLLGLQKAREVMDPVEGCDVPEVLWSDVERGLSLTGFAKGDNGRWALRTAALGVADREDILKRMGHFIGEFHRRSLEATVAFRPAVYLRQVRKLASALRASEIDVPRPRRFLGLCAFLHRAAARIEGAPVMHSQLHGDFHLFNLLVMDECISAVDFSGRAPGPAHSDVARFWNYASDIFDPTEGEACGFAGLPCADWHAFEKGYGADLADDPVFHFFFIHQIFVEWRKLIGRRQDLSAELHLQLDRLIGRLDWFLAGEDQADSRSK